MRRPPSRITHAWSATATWLLVLAGGTLLFRLTTSPPPQGSWSLLQIVLGLVGLTGFVLPYVAFVGGLVLSGGSDGGRARARVLWTGLPIAIIAYLLTAVARPLVEDAASATAGSSNQVQRPFGPITPSALWEQREYVLANPPGDYSLSIDRPFEQPPNWLALLILLPVVLSGYAVLNTALGLAAGAVTSGLSPPARRNARWAIGLLGGIAFFVALAVADSAVRASPETSAFLGVLPLFVPVGELVLLVFLIRRRDGRLHVLKDADV